MQDGGSWLLAFSWADDCVRGAKSGKIERMEGEEKGIELQLSIVSEGSILPRL